MTAREVQPDQDIGGALVAEHFQAVAHSLPVGITPGEYIAIGQAAQNSEELSERINTRISELLDKQQPKSE